MKQRTEHADVVIIGSGVGGATLAYALAGKDIKVLILERGAFLPLSRECADARAIFQRGFFRNSEDWFDKEGQAFRAGNYYYVGGNSKFYGAVMLRYRQQDFGGLSYPDGDTPAWPFDYAELEPYYCEAERLFAVRGDASQDHTEPPHSQPYAYGPVADEEEIARVRGELKAQGLHPFSLPLAVDIDKWLHHQQTPWDAFPNACHGKIDAENGPLKQALRHANVELMTGVCVQRMLADVDGNKIRSLECQRDGQALKG